MRTIRNFSLSSVFALLTLSVVIVTAVSFTIFLPIYTGFQSFFDSLTPYLLLLALIPFVIITWRFRSEFAEYLNRIMARAVQLFASTGTFRA